MKEQKTFMVDILFLLALFVLFTISSLILVSVGAEVYRQTTSDMSTNYDMRTSIAYITEERSFLSKSLNSTISKSI